VAGASLLALLDDIAALMDDVSVMTKVAARKTAGVLGDDLAVNAEKVTGVAADRELRVVYAVFRGSLLNKAMLVPGALVIAVVAPWLISPLLLAGGLFLCFEGAEKVWHALSHSREERSAEMEALRAELEAPGADPLALERRRIRGAIRTDLILSAEIIVITLGIVGDASLAVRAAVLTTIAVVMTVGVYGLVAAIVKMDDAGLYLYQVDGEGGGRTVLRALGRLLLAIAPRFMRLLTVVGTVAMFLVGGGILVHGVPLLHHALEVVLHLLPSGLAEGPVNAVATQVFTACLGLAAGAVVVLTVSVVGRFRAD
jgi:predicted DNA repair protein MutK